MLEATLVLLGLLVVLGGPVAFIMALIQHGTIKQLTKRIADLEARLASPQWQRQAEPPPVSQPKTPAPPRPAVPPPAPAPQPPASIPAHWQPTPQAAAPKREELEKVDAIAAGAVTETLPASAAEPETPVKPLETTPPPEPSQPVPPPASAPAPEAAPALPAVSAAASEAVRQAAPAEEGGDWESRIGKRWLTWGGVLLLATAVGFLVKYAYEQGWIGPWSQVILGLAVGCGLCLFGDWQIRKRDMRPLGQGVMALGLALVYLTSFGAYAYFKLDAVSQMTALALLALTSAAGVLLANRHRSLPICILSALGGYLAPILVSTGQPPPINGLFAYTLIVNLGIIAVAILRSWPALPLVAFCGTMAHFWGWHYKFYEPEQAALVAAWAAGFHFVFLFLPAFPLVKGARTTPWQWLLPPANAMTAVWAVWRHLYEPHPLALFLLLVAMALGHLAIGLWRFTNPDAKRPDDLARGIYVGLGLAMLTLAPLSWLGIQASLVSWLVLGLLLVDLGFRLDFRLFRIFGYANLAFGLAWCVLRFRTVIDTEYPWEILTLGLASIDAGTIKSLYGSLDEFFAALFGVKVFWTRLAGPAALGVAVWLFHKWRDKAPDRNLAAKIICGVAAGFAAAVFISLDVNPWLWLRAEPGMGGYARSCALVPLWCLGAAATAWCGRRWRLSVVGWLSLLFLLPASSLAIRDFYLARVDEPDALFLNCGFLACVVFVATAMWVCRVVGGKRHTLYAGLAGYLLVLAVQVEINKIPWEEFVVYNRQVWRAMVWTVAAMGYTVLAWRRQNRDLAWCFWFPIAAGTFFLYHAVMERIGVDPLPAAFANWAYAAGLALALAWFMRAKLISGGGAIWMAIIGGWVVLAVHHVEIHDWLLSKAELGDYNSAYQRMASPSLLWTAGAVIYAELARRFRQPRLVVGMLPPLAVGVGLAVYVLNMRPGLNPLPFPFLNTIFVAGILATAALFLAALADTKRREWWGIASGLLILLAIHGEIAYTFGPWVRHEDFQARVPWYTLVWAAGAAGYLAAALRIKGNRVYYAGLGVLAVSIACFFWQYTTPYLGSYRLFLNMRFLSSTAMMIAMWAFCHAGGRHGRDAREGGFIRMGKTARTTLYVLTACFGLFLLSQECRLWCLARFGDGEEGARLARMAVSIVWAVYSITLLGIGFFTRIRGWRLAGLALFGATCVKLVLFDLRHLDPLHRILAFMAVGLLLMAASYLYHKLERRLRNR